MPSKTEEYLALAQRTANGLTRYWESWTDYSKKFLEAHREEITLHKAAKAAFDEAGLQKLPKVKELDAEFAELLTKKKAAYPDYRKARNEMQELVRAQKNVERFFAEEKQYRRTSRLDKNKIPGVDREWSAPGIFYVLLSYRKQRSLLIVYWARHSRYSMECKQLY